MRLTRYLLATILLLTGSGLMAWAAQEGEVTVPLTEWNRLQDQLRELQQRIESLGRETTEVEAPSAVISAAVYDARVVKGGLDLTATLRVTAFGAGRAELPLFDQRGTVVSASLPPEISLTANGARSVLLVKAPGSYEVKLRVAVAAENNRAALGVPRAGAALIRVILPGTTASARIEPASGTARKVEGNTTIVEAALPVTEQVGIEWSALGGGGEAEQGPGRVYLTAATAVVVEGTALRANTRLAYEIKGGSAAEFAVAVPAGVSIADVQGEGLASWKAEAAGNRQVLHILPTAPVVGAARYDIIWEIPLAREAEVAEIPRLSGLEVVREAGHVGVAGGDAIEVNGEGKEGITPLDPRNAPVELTGLCDRPFAYVGRYLGNTWLVNVGIKRLEAVEVVAARIEEARGTTVFLPTGRQVTKLTASVRNSTVEYLDLTLPPNARVWGAAVAGKTVLPIRGGADTIVRLPLVRAQSAESAGEPFSVEIVYAVDGADPGLGGVLTVIPPRLSIDAAKLYWSVSLPEEFRWCWDRTRDWEDNDVIISGGGGYGRWYAPETKALPSTIHGFPDPDDAGRRVRATYYSHPDAGQSAGNLSIVFLTEKPGRGLGLLVLFAALGLTLRSLLRWELPRRWRIILVAIAAVTLVIEIFFGGGGLRRLIQGVVIGALLAGTAKLLEPDPDPEADHRAS